MFLNKQGQRKINQVIGQLVITNTAQPITINGRDCTIMNLTGNTWVNPLGTAVATGGSSFLLVPGKEISITANTLSLISDGSGSTAQIIVYE